MGAVPKVRISKRRKNNRRAHHGLKAPTLSVCPKCKQPKRPHFKCQECGFYGELESEKTTKKSKK